MKLEEVTIRGFKSVKDQIKLLIDSRVTIFIGANDHGKSNLLEAIRALNDDRPITKEDVHWDWQDTPDSNTPRIEWHFKCSKELIQKMQEIVHASVPEPSETLVDQGVPPAEETNISEVPATGTVPEESPIEMLPTNTENKLVLCRDGVDSVITIISAPLEVPKAKEAEVIALKPRAELFVPPNIDLKDETTQEELVSNPDFEFMQGIFRLAKIWDDRETIFTTNDSTTRKLDEASVALTKILNTTWNQGKNLDWKLKHVGDKIGIFIKDPAVSGRYTRPSLKSSGFQTYFLLSMITYARTTASASNSYIYLFDEPGTNLHPRAQIDLQRSLEALSDTTQILYTTHSLFLINKNYPDRNTVVVKTDTGTQVNIKPFQRNWKAVRESLGILLSNNFLIAEKTVMVEGPSDVIYLLRAIKTLKKIGKSNIDLNDLSIVDAGDASNYIAMVKLMLEEGRSVLAILDGDSQGDGSKKQLEKVCEAELRTKQLEIKQLDKDTSSEDVLVNLDDLRKAVTNVANELTASGNRKFKDELDVTSEVKKIKTKSGTTLGRTIDETTTSWFDPAEKISKLSIALQYEDISNVTTIEPKAEKLVESISKSLKLRAEKAYEEGVFETV